jgi:photosystem II stability/assembly factor-like uncharacterized protein
MPARRPLPDADAGRETGDRSRPRIRLPLAVSGASLLAAALVLVWTVRHDESETASPAELPHVHGMAVNPADGLLYVATHGGLFVLDEHGSADRVGDGRQDTMGFTVAGPNHFLASGHPAPGEDGPSSLGLIGSTDAGRTWEPLSMGGQADFHALRYAHGIVYGFDSATGQLLVSEDSMHWEARGSQPLIDLAVNPTDPDALVATALSGLLHSGDGGRTWEPVSAEPMAFLHWSNSGLLWGIGPNGEIYKNYDEGVTWEPAIGSVEAAPTAFAVVGDELFVATEDGRILASEDFGWNWREAFRSA